MNKDTSWSKLQSTFDGCRGSAKRPLRTSRTQNRKNASKLSAVVLKPVPRRNPVRDISFLDADVSDKSCPKTPNKKRCTSPLVAAVVASPPNKENESVNNIDISDDDSIDFDPDRDGGDFGQSHIPNASRPSLPVYTSSRHSTGHQSSAMLHPLPSLRASIKRRVNFTNILCSLEVTAQCTAVAWPDVDVEIPETQTQPGIGASFHIDEMNTEDMLGACIDETIIANNSNSICSITNPGSQPQPTTSGQQQLADTIRGDSSLSNTSAPLSAPYKHLPAVRHGRRRVRAGGLIEQLDASINRAKSSTAFWLHERRAGLVEAGTIVQVLELDDDWSRQLGAFGGCGGGCAVRVREMCAKRAAAVATTTTAVQDSMILLLDGDLKLCAHLAVGTRLEVDLRAASRLSVRLTEGDWSGMVSVYPNVQFIREWRE